MNSKSIRDTDSWLTSYIPTSFLHHSRPIQSFGNAPYSPTLLPVEDMVDVEDSDTHNEVVGNRLSKVSVANPSQNCKEVSKAQEHVQ